MQVASNDDLPSQVCSRCLHNLNVSYKLIITSIKVDLHLRKQLSDSKKQENAQIQQNHRENNEETLNSISENETEFCMKRLNTKAVCGPMECEMCDKEFIDMEEFDKHVETVHLLPWPCSLCDKSFQTSAKLVAHKESQHAGNVRICTSCADRKSLAHGLLSLAAMQNNGKPIKTFKINKKVGDTAKSNEEIEQNISNAENICLICKEIYLKPEYLSAHQKIHHPNHQRCHKCQAVLPSIHELHVHNREFHPGKSHALTFAKVCETCTTVFTTNEKYVEHLKTGYCKEMHDCKYCDLSFTTNPKLTQHLRVSNEYSI